MRKIFKLSFFFTYINCDPHKCRETVATDGLNDAVRAVQDVWGGKGDLKIVFVKIFHNLGGA